MAIDATGTPTPLGIPKFNTAVDAPSGKGNNAQMDAIDTLIAARVLAPAGVVSGEAAVWNGSAWVRSSVTPITANGLTGVVAKNDYALVASPTNVAPNARHQFVTFTSGSATLTNFGAPTEAGSLLTIRSLVGTLSISHAAGGSGQFYNSGVGGGTTLSLPNDTYATYVFDGGTWQLIAVNKASASGTLLGIQVLTTSGTYTPTSGTGKVYIEMVGGGGGSGGIAAPVNNSAGSAGGGGGAYAASLLTSGFSGASYTIGAGGSAGTAGNNAGGNGGDTSFGASVIVAKGGQGGSGGAAGGSPGGGAVAGNGGSAASSTGTIKIDGGDGGYVLGGGINGGGQNGGSGGSSMFSEGIGMVVAISALVAAKAGKLYGGGASGVCASNQNIAAQAGAAGAAGVIRVWEFA